MMTVLRFWLILAPSGAIFLSILGSVFFKAPQDVPRLSQGLQKDVPGGDFEGKGGIPKVEHPSAKGL